MRRIQRDVSHEELVKKLTGADSLFGEIWRLLLFAAGLGYKSGKRRKLLKVDSAKSMPVSYFSAPDWKGFLYLLAVCETNSSEPLRADSEQEELLVQLFEEYANEGLFIIEERVRSSISPLDELVVLMMEFLSEGAERPDVEELI